MCLVNKHGGTSLLSNDLFLPWEDPQSGVLSYLLQSDVCGIQQSFYFTNPSMVGQFLWFYAIDPPAEGRYLGVIDLVTGEIRVYPETRFSDASPYIDPQTAEVYWAVNTHMGGEVWRRGPRPEQTAEKIWTLPERHQKHRYLFEFCTHLTMSADRREMNVDFRIGSEFGLATFPIDGSGEGEVWQWWDRKINHSQFSPVDSDLILLAEDWTRDPMSGEYLHIDNRMWLIRRGQPAEAIFPEYRAENYIVNEGGDFHLHEWWGGSGEHVWYVGFNTGTHRVNIRTREDEVIFAEGNCHSHTSPDERFVVADCDAYTFQQTHSGRPCRVMLYDRQRDTSVNIVSNDPAIESLPWGEAPRYHFDPHPQFTYDGKYILYTTGVRGKFQLAIIPMEQWV